ncbi:hypothetical protein CATMIT_01784, partial [Catenibacterium mitsuokai DSM 15897]
RGHRAVRVPGHLPGNRRGRRGRAGGGHRRGRRSVLPGHLAGHALAQARPRDLDADRRRQRDLRRGGGDGDRAGGQGPGAQGVGGGGDGGGVRHRRHVRVPVGVSLPGPERACLRRVRRLDHPRGGAGGGRRARGERAGGVGGGDREDAAGDAAGAVPADPVLAPGRGRRGRRAALEDRDPMVRAAVRRGQRDQFAAP